MYIETYETKKNKLSYMLNFNIVDFQIQIITSFSIWMETIYSAFKHLVTVCYL